LMRWWINARPEHSLDEMVDNAPLGHFYIILQGNPRTSGTLP
jgi:hypothetical protein